MNYQTTELRRILRDLIDKDEAFMGKQKRPLWGAQTLVKIAKVQGLTIDLGIAVCKESFRAEGYDVRKNGCLLVIEADTDWWGFYIFDRDLPYGGKIRKSDPRITLVVGPERELPPR